MSAKVLTVREWHGNARILVETADAVDKEIDRMWATISALLGICGEEPSCAMIGIIQLGYDHVDRLTAIRDLIEQARVLA